MTDTAELARSQGQLVITLPCRYSRGTDIDARGCLALDQRRYTTSYITYIITCYISSFIGPSGYLDHETEL